MDKDILFNFFTFDVKKFDPLIFWIMKENFNSSNNLTSKAYFQHITQFNINDIFEINISIFNQKGFIQLFYNKLNKSISSFKWKSLIINNLSSLNELYNIISNNNVIGSKLYREQIDNNTMKFCEAEFLINSWKKVSSLNIKTYKSLGDMFYPYFIIKEMFYDNIGYLIYKIILLACKEGILKDGDKIMSNSNSLNSIGINLIVKNKNISRANEVKKNNLLHDITNKVECKVGDIIIYYFNYHNSN